MSVTNKIHPDSGAASEESEDDSVPEGLPRQSSMLYGAKQTQVSVIVRVRPLIGREKAKKDGKCVKIHGLNAVMVTVPDSDGKPEKKQFTFDRAFNESSKQSEVFEASAKRIVEQAMQGFNGSMFCYGQTGSGKTFTMYGEEEESKRGIIFQAADMIEDIRKKKESEVDFSFKVSFLEIYNEELRDLFINSEKKSGKRLKIRQKKNGSGVYVDGASHKSCKDLTNLKEWIEEGQKNRTVGQTDMNAQSSRSHSVLCISIRQRPVTDEEELLVQESSLYLIDLAGSERAGQNKSTERMMEGAKINLSLTSLGLVIKALVDKQKFIPYRNSQLTRLLQDSLGGNAMTTMIANMSPADSNCFETLSTLQFANRAKSIKNSALKFQDPRVAKLAQLMDELKAVKEELHIERNKRLQLEEQMANQKQRRNGDGAKEVGCLGCRVM